jgi:hypothetical protein
VVVVVPVVEVLGACQKSPHPANKGVTASKSRAQVLSFIVTPRSTSVLRQTDSKAEARRRFALFKTNSLLPESTHLPALPLAAILFCSIRSRRCLCRDLDRPLQKRRNSNRNRSRKTQFRVSGSDYH